MNHEIPTATKSRPYVSNRPPQDPEMNPYWIEQLAGDTWFAWEWTGKYWRCVADSLEAGDEKE